MRKIKDSGIEWIGEMPEEWAMQKIKYVATLSPRINYSFCTKNSVGYVPMECLKKGYMTPLEGDFDSFSSGLTPFQEDDIVMAKVTPCFENGNIAIAKGLPQKVAFGSSELFVLRSKSVDNNFLFYLLQSESLKNMCVSTMTGSGGLKRVSPYFLENVIIPLPSILEQQDIASHLNSKCTEIDSLVSDIEMQISTLEEYKRSVITEAVTKGLDPTVPMKDSGIEWIGKIPEHWECVRGKYILEYLQKPVRKDDDVITCFRDGEVTLRSNRREDGFTMSDKEIGYQGVDVGDLVVHGMDGFAGAIGISDSRGKASPVLNVLNTGHSKRYIMYYLRSMAYSDVFTAIATGIRVRSCDLRWNKLAELQYPAPPISEQEYIVEYIDTVLQQTNEIILNKKQQIETLNNYKKSLIYEYVTGKKEIPA